MAAILDQFGNPIQREVLQTEQTSQLMDLYHRIAAHPVRGLTPQRLNRILEDAEMGNIVAQHELFMDMEERDSHIFAEMNKRKRALLTLNWSVEAPDDAAPAEEELAESAEDWLKSIPNLPELFFDCMDAVGHGFACLEIDWMRRDSDWVPRAVTHRPQSWFWIRPQHPDEVRLRDGSVDGAVLWPFGWVKHIHKAKSGYIARSGLHRVLSWPFLFRAYSARDLAEFLEIYGLPLRLGKYPNGANEAEKNTLLRAVVGIGHDAAGIIPQGMEIDFKEAAKGTHDPFMAMMNWSEISVSKAVLGGTLTSQADGKSSTNALGNVHNEVRHDLLESDARQVANTLTQSLIYPYLALNRGFSDMQRVPRLVFDTRQPADLALYADSLPKLVGIGMEIPTAWAHETLHIPKRQKTEPVLKASVVAAPASDNATQQVASADAALRLAVLTMEKRLQSASDTPDIQLQRLLAEATQDTMIGPIAKLVREASSLEALRDGLLETFKDMDAGQFQVIMATALQAAALAGRFEVLNAR